MASLALMIIYRQNMINTCIRSGFVSFNNAQTGLVPSNISTNGYYTPVKYPNTLNAHATSAEDCQQAIRLLIITWGVIIFVVQLVQVKKKIGSMVSIVTDSWSLYSFILQRLSVVMPTDWVVERAIIVFMINKLRILRNPVSICPLCIKEKKNKENRHLTIRIYYSIFFHVNKSMFVYLLVFNWVFFFFNWS